MSSGVGEVGVRGTQDGPGSWRDYGEPELPVPLAAALAAGTELPAAVELAMRVGAIATRSEGAQPSYPSRAMLNEV